MTLMQTRQGTTGKFRLWRVRYPFRLAPCRRVDEQIFELIEGKPAILQLGRRACGNRVVTVRYVRKRRDLLV